MAAKVGQVLEEMMLYYAQDKKRQLHFIKVYAFAKTISDQEGLPYSRQLSLELASILHDIGVKICQTRYGSTAAIYQQLEGPPLAREMLTRLGFDESIIERVCYLVGNHHRYHDIDGADYQILIEADFLVNMEEEPMTQQEMLDTKQKIFRTKTGLRLLEELYL